MALTKYCLSISSIYIINTTNKVFIHLYYTYTKSTACITNAGLSFYEQMCTINVGL